MLKRLVIVSAVAAALGLATFSALPGATAQNGATATVVAVVDLNQVLKNSKAFATMQAAQQTRQTEQQTELETRQGEIAALNSQLDTLGVGTPAWDAKRRELLETATEARAWSEVNKQLENGTRGREFLGIYEAANAAVAAVAADRGIDIVLTAGALPDLKQLAGADPQQIAAVLQNRQVLYNTEAIDISQAVLTRFNADYESKN